MPPRTRTLHRPIPTHSNKKAVVIHPAITPHGPSALSNEMRSNDLPWKRLVLKSRNFHSLTSDFRVPRVDQLGHYPRYGRRVPLRWCLKVWVNYLAKVRTISYKKTILSQWGYDGQSLFKNSEISCTLPTNYPTLPQANRGQFPKSGHTLAPPYQAPAPIGRHS